MWHDCLRNEAEMGSTIPSAIAAEGRGGPGPPIIFGIFFLYTNKWFDT